MHPCAANIHVKCATQMQQEMENGVRMCYTIHDFITCYENPEEPCFAEIYTDFINLLNKFVSQIIEMYEELPPSVMPGCKRILFKGVNRRHCPNLLLPMRNTEGACKLQLACKTSIFGQKITWV